MRKWIQRPAATREVADWIRGLRYEDLPQRTREVVRCAILDTLGCGVYGYETPWAQMLLQWARAGGTNPKRRCGAMRSPSLARRRRGARERHVVARFRARRLSQRKAASRRGGRACRARHGGEAEFRRHAPRHRDRRRLRSDDPLEPCVESFGDAPARLAPDRRLRAVRRRGRVRGADGASTPSAPRGRSVLPARKAPDCGRSTPTAR